MSFLKRILAVVAGVAVGLILVMAGDFASSYVAPVLRTIDPADQQNMAQVMTLVPLSAFILMLVGYGLGAFLGGSVATLISGRAVARPAAIVGIILTIGNIFNQMELSHPLWFTIASTLIYIPFALLGYKLAERKVHV